MAHKSIETGLPTHALFSKREVAEFGDLDDRFVTWLRENDRAGSSRMHRAAAHYDEGEYNLLMEALQAEFHDTDGCMTAEDMRTAAAWYECVTMGLYV